MPSGRRNCRPRSLPWRARRAPSAPSPDAIGTTTRMEYTGASAVAPRSFAVLRSSIPVPGGQVFGRPPRRRTSPRRTITDFSCGPPRCWPRSATPTSGTFSRMGPSRPASGTASIPPPSASRPNRRGGGPNAPPPAKPGQCLSAPPLGFQSLRGGILVAFRRAEAAMKKLLGILLLTGASAFAAHFSIGVGIGYPVYAPAPVAVYAPPPPPVYSYYRPVAPGPGYYWVGGYWYPNGPRYAWRAGYWARPPY